MQSPSAELLLLLITLPVPEDPRPSGRGAMRFGEISSNSFVVFLLVPVIDLLFAILFNGPSITL